MFLMKITFISNNMKSVDLLNETYEIIEEIGAGGGGVVYHAIHKRLQTDVVIKRIKDEVLGKIGSRQEADVLKKLKHPYLPRVYDFIETDEGVYTVMDFIKGRNLEQSLLEHGPYSQMEVRKWANQLGEALDYLHRQNPPIIHSDIKPANIMLSPEGDICLIDFNISLAMGNDEAIAVGISAGFSPPEQYRDPGVYFKYTHSYSNNVTDDDKTEILSEYCDESMVSHNGTEILTSSDAMVKSTSDRNSTYMPYIGKGITTRSDIYSLGICFVTLLTGLAPEIDFDKNISIKDRKIAISDGFANIIDRMVRINPDDRYKDGTDFLNAIRNCYKYDKKYVSMHRKEMVLRAASLSLAVVGAGFLTLGMYRLKSERSTIYYSYVTDINQMIDAGDYDSANLKIKELKALNKSVDPYYEEVYLYYSKGEYQTARELGEEYLLTQPFYIESDYDRAKFADIYYLVANSHYELGHYSESVRFFEEALKVNNTNPGIYRDYAIALAKCGMLTESASVLDEAASSGLSDDSIELVKGEIYYESGELSDAISSFKRVIDATSDASVKRRAVLMLTDCYQEVGGDGIDEAVELLNSVLGGVDRGSRMVISDRLADIYSRKATLDPDNAEEYYKKAISIFEDLKSSGYATFLVNENIGILYENMGDISKAEEVFEQMLNEFSGRYEVYMRLAYLEIDRQQELDVADRDYHRFKEYYDEASKIYDSNIQDVEMIMLGQLLDDIKSGGWSID